MSQNAAAEQYNIKTCEEISIQSGKQECPLPNTGAEAGLIGGIGLLAVIAGVALKRGLDRL